MAVTTYVGIVALEPGCKEDKLLMDVKIPVIVEISMNPKDLLSITQPIDLRDLIHQGDYD